MLQMFLSSLKANASNDADATTDTTRRRHPRRDVDRCVAVVHGQTFPIINWSLSGVLVAADERLFGVGKNIDMVLKFKLRNVIIDVPLKCDVVRKTSGKIALEFEPLNLTIKRSFQQVIDDYSAREFANSQV